jgi:hypothetical protein
MEGFLLRMRRTKGTGKILNMWVILNDIGGDHAYGRLLDNAQDLFGDSSGFNSD